MTSKQLFSKFEALENGMKENQYLLDAITSMNYDALERAFARLEKDLRAGLSKSTLA